MNQPSAASFPPPAKTIKQRAQSGFEAYCASLEQQGLLPPFALRWEKMQDAVQQAWIAAAKGVLAEGS